MRTVDCVSLVEPAGRRQSRAGAVQRPEAGSAETRRPRHQTRALESTSPPYPDPKNELDIRAHNVEFMKKARTSAAMHSMRACSMAASCPARSASIFFRGPAATVRCL